MRKILTILIVVLSTQFSFNLSAECIEGNCTNGQGTYNYRLNGDQYIGEFKDDKRHGQGTYTWAEGSQYIGEWKDNKKHGQGTYTWIFGGKQTGIWENDEYIGTVFELEEKRKADAIKAEQEREERIKYNKIFNACYLDKGADVDMTSSIMRGVVNEVCSDIANDPSFLESWKYE
jgi:hypothetical protein